MNTEETTPHTDEDQSSPEELAGDAPTSATDPLELMPPMLPRIDSPAEQALAVWEENMPERLYHADRSAVSQSALKEMIQKSPMHFLYKWSIRDGDEPPTDAQRIGTLLHLALLEPEKYAARVVIAKKFDRRTKEGKAGAKAFEASLAPDAIVVDVNEKKQIEAMAISVMSDDMAGPILRSSTMRKELTGYFTCSLTGVRCRIRLDGYDPSGDRLIIDLKTTEDASDEAISKTIWNWRYDVQAATYLEGAMVIDKIPMSEPVPLYVWIFVEKAPPYACVVRFPDEDMLERANADRVAAMRRLKECIVANKWPGYPAAKSIGLPAWAKRKQQ